MKHGPILNENIRLRRVSSVEINIQRHQLLLRTLVSRIELVPDGEELAIVQRSDLAAILTFACGKKNPTFRCQYKLEAVKLVRERGGTVAQAARDLDVHENMLRKWVRNKATIPPVLSWRRADEAGAA